MPGVPTGRACEACRKQKKKCDEARPACSRCARLRVPCVGSGERRFKFKPTVVLEGTKPSSACQESRIAFEDSASLASFGLFPFPTNPAAQTSGSLISRLSVIDPRFSLACYGSFLDEIPRRLGHNAALDASVDSLTCSFANLATRQSSLQSITKYGYALNALRLCLNDPVKSKAPETLCAIYFVLISEGWIGDLAERRTMSHGEGLAHVLNNISYENYTSSFEREMVITLCLPVIIESMVNPRVQIPEALISHIEQSWSCKTRNDSTKASNMPDLIAGLRNIQAMANYLHDPYSHLEEIRLAYDKMRKDTISLRDALDEMDAVPAVPASPASARATELGMRAHSQVQAAFGVLLSLTLLSNTTLRAFYTNKKVLEEDSTAFCADVLKLSKSASQYRPMAASYVPLPLILAWAATDDATMQEELAEMVLDYQKDFFMNRWMECARWVRNKLDCVRAQAHELRINGELHSILTFPPADSEYES